MLKRLSLLITFAVFFSGCSKNNFPEYIALGDIRILTIIVDHPEVDPGTTVNLTPVISDYHGGGRGLNYSIYGCVDPGIGVGAPATCKNPDAGTISSGTVSPPAGNTSTFTGAVASFPITVPASTTIFAGRSPVQQYNGVSYLVFYTIAVPGGGPSVTAFVRVVVSSTLKTAKNQNPVLTAINMNDNPLGATTTLPTIPAGFRANLTSDSVEGYFSMQKDGSLAAQTEELITTWFISGGTFDFYRTVGGDANSWTPLGSLPVGQGVIMLAVTRDGRGGAAYQKVEFN